MNKQYRYDPQKLIFHFKNNMGQFFHLASRNKEICIRLPMEKGRLHEYREKIKFACVRLFAELQNGQ